MWRSPWLAAALAVAVWVLTAITVSSISRQSHSFDARRRLAPPAHLNDAYLTDPCAFAEKHAENFHDDLDLECDGDDDICKAETAAMNDKILASRAVCASNSQTSLRVAHRSRYDTKNNPEVSSTSAACCCNGACQQIKELCQPPTGPTIGNGRPLQLQTFFIKPFVGLFSQLNQLASVASADIERRMFVPNESLERRIALRGSSALSSLSVEQRTRLLGVHIRQGDKAEEQGGVVVPLKQLARAIRVYLRRRELLAVYLMSDGVDVARQLRTLLPDVPVVTYADAHADADAGGEGKDSDVVLDLLADVFTLLRRSSALLGGVSSNLFRFAVQNTGLPFLDTDAITALTAEQAYGPLGYWIQAHLCQCSAVRVVNGTVCVGHRPSAGSRFRYCRTYGAKPGYCMQTAHYKLWGHQHAYLRWPNSDKFPQISSDGVL